MRNVSDGTAWAQWHRYFAEILVSGDAAEIDAATRAAVGATTAGASEAEVKATGKAEARRYRAAGGRPAGSAPGPDNGGGPRLRQHPSGPATGVRDDLCTDGWSALAPRLFAPPVRWGWKAAVLPDPEPTAPRAMELGPRPVWTELPRPDDGHLVAARSRAIRKLAVRIVVAVVAVLGFGIYQPMINDRVSSGGANATKVFGYVLIGVAVIAGIMILQSLSALIRTSADIRRFRQPYLAARSAEQQRHRRALQEWEDAKRRLEAEQRAAQQAAQRLREGPQWYPVHPVSEPTRVDVLGGDPHRYGWAGLLVLLGTSLLMHGHRITVIDFTGLKVGGELAEVAAAGGRSVRWETVGDGSDLDLLDTLPGSEVPDCLAYALVAPPGRTGQGDSRQERALARDVLRRVVNSFDGPITYGRLAAGLHVLQRGGDSPELSGTEIGKLVSGIGNIDQSEWTGRHLRYWTEQLEILDRLGPGLRPLWPPDEVLVLATPGGRDDRKELIDRLMVQLAQRAMRIPGRLGSALVVVGADHLGADTINTLSEHARLAGLRLVLFLDQPQGDLEKTVGTGGAVCIMKMYNHRDANIAAEFIGKGYKFVVNQFTRTVGKSFTDGGNDSFAATSNSGSGSAHKRMHTEQSTTDSRGHTWTGARNWAVADNISTATGTARVYEFITDPQAILGMAETAFILVDNSGQGRRVMLADAYPGIIRLPRLSATPEP